MDLATATPVEIDTVLAGIYEREQRVLSLIAWQEGYAENYREGIAKREAGHLAYSGYTQEALDEVLAKIETLKEERRLLRVEAAPFEDEYNRRPWTRAFLVLNTNGHVHRSTDCSTTYATTQWGWLPQESGKTEVEIVDGAGADACTVCYPTAPVESLSRPRRTLHASEVEAQKAREAKAAAKAEREAKKAAKAIGPLSVFTWRAPERQIRERDGSITVKPAEDRFETITTLAAAKSWLTDSQETWTSKRPEDVQMVAAAIAAKVGTTADEEIAAASKRAAKRR